MSIRAHQQPAPDPWTPPEPWRRASSAKPAAFQPLRGPVWPTSEGAGKCKHTQSPKSHTRQYDGGGRARSDFGTHPSPRESVRHMNRKKAYVL